MSLSILPKSEVRKVKSISYGYGEVPIAEINGKRGYALPGGQIVFDETRAVQYAKEIDKVIRSTIDDPTKANRLRN